MRDRNHRAALHIFRHPDRFALLASHRRLRTYQRQVLEAVVASIRQKAGRSFVVIFARQSGKNELQAQLFAYLLAVLSRSALNIVSVSPTFTPQTINGISRLEKVLTANLFTRRGWSRRDGYKLCYGSSQVVFLSGHPSANVVGHTAHILLSVDEAQAFDPIRFDTTFSPMAAAHNATRVFWGTSWTSDTLLARQRRLAQAAEQADGIRRLWVVPGDVVAVEVPSYASFLETEIRHLGRNNPIVRSQYFCEEIDSQVGMFTPARLALMAPDQPPHESPSPFAVLANGEGWGGAGAQPPQQTPSPSPSCEMGTSRGDHKSPAAVSAARAADGRGGVEPPMSPPLNPQVGGLAGSDSPPISGFGNGGSERGVGYAFLLDVAGQDEARMNLGDDSPLTNPGRDSVSLTIATIDLSTLATLQAPTYRFVNRMQWTGLNHLVIFGKLQNLIQTWNPQHIVMDATGVGEGLWAMLDKAFPTRVTPVKFSQQVKSEIGWRYLAIIETGRVRDCCLTDPVRAQYDACQSEILPGPGKVLRWGVPEGARGPDGELIHDDYILADALIAVLDRLEWTASTEVTAAEGYEPLEGLQ